MSCSTFRRHCAVLGEDDEVGEFFSNEAFDATGDGCVTSRTYNGFEFGLGTDNKLYGTPLFLDTPLDLTASVYASWGSPAQVLTGTPAASSWGPGEIDAYVRSSSNSTAVYHASTDDGGNTVQGWDELSYSSPFVQDPSAVSWGPGNKQVFAVASGSGGQPVLVRDSWDWANGAWSGWQTINLPTFGGVSGVPEANVAVASWGATSSFPQGGLPTQFPTDPRTVVAVFFDSTNGGFEVGSSVNYGAFNWTFFGVASGIDVTKNLALAVENPPVVDIFGINGSGEMVQIRSPDFFATRQFSVTTYPAQFAPGPVDVAAAVGLGDGRVAFGGRIGGDGGAGWFGLNVWANGSSWTQGPGAYNSGLGYVAW